MNLVNGKDFSLVPKKVGPDNTKYDDLKDEHLSDKLEGVVSSTSFDFGIMTKYNDEAIAMSSKGFTFASTFDAAGKIKDET